VADPVPGQVGRLAAGVTAGQAQARRVLVDVVAQVQDHVEVLLGEVAVGGVPALLVVLAGDDGQGEAAKGARASAQVRVRPTRLRWPPARNRYQ
jgi:hypothetical protein